MAPKAPVESSVQDMCPRKQCMRWRWRQKHHSVAPFLGLPFLAFLFPFWKRLKGKKPEGKNFRELLRRKQSSAKISKISRNTIKSSKSDIFYLLRNLLKYLLRTFFSSAKFSEVFALRVFTLWLFPTLGVFRGQILEDLSRNVQSET